MIIRNRGGTAARWALVNPILAAREIGVETDTGRAKVGDGLRAWSELPYISGEPLDGNDVLALLADVDGSGSGLDADTLDGQQATAFAASTHAATHAAAGADPVSIDASQVATGVLDDARIPSGVARDAEVAAATSVMRYLPFDMELMPSGTSLLFPRLAWSITGIQVVNGDEVWSQIHLDGGFTVQHLAVNVTVSASQGQARISLYPAGPSGMPEGDLIEDLGTVSLSTPGAKAAVFSAPRYLPAGVYWCRVLVFDGLTNPSLVCATNTAFIHFPTEGAFAGYSTVARTCFRRSGIVDGGAAPATVPAGLNYGRYATIVAVTAA